MWETGGHVHYSSRLTISPVGFSLSPVLILTVNITPNTLPVSAVVQDCRDCVRRSWVCFPRSPADWNVNFLAEETQILSLQQVQKLVPCTFLKYLTLIRGIFSLIWSPSLMSGFVSITSWGKSVLIISYCNSPFSTHDDHRYHLDLGFLEMHSFFARLANNTYWPTSTLHLVSLQ